MIESSSMPKAIVIGMPGAGKTRLGKETAALIKAPFRDTDQCIEEEAGQSVSEIFDTQGEQAFRDMETRAVLDLLKDFPGGILSLGEGLP